MTAAEFSEFIRVAAKEHEIHLSATIIDKDGGSGSVHAFDNLYATQIIGGLVIAANQICIDLNTTK